jgi:3-hydroxyisobutyrate dehydrogenase-like beta-hydroxyacid dehydrogenase
MGDRVLTTTNTTMTKEQAIIKILKVLKNAMLVVNKHNRDEALTLAEEYGITAKELIETWSDMAMRV